MRAGTRAGSDRMGDEGGANAIDLGAAECIGAPSNVSPGREYAAESGGNFGENLPVRPRRRGKNFAGGRRFALGFFDAQVGRPRREDIARRRDAGWILGGLGERDALRSKGE